MTKPSELLAAPFRDDSPVHDPAGWFSSVRMPPAQLRKDSERPTPARRRTPETERSRPSDSGHGTLPGAAIFSESGGLHFGSEVHEWLAKIEWLPAPPEVPPVLAAFLADPVVASLFERPSDAAMVWRERSLACRLQGRQISAQMDRVVIDPPKGERPGSILLVDFKTDQGEPEEIAKKYHAQMRDYLGILNVWSAGRHSVRGVVATVRRPAVIPVPAE